MTERRNNPQSSADPAADAGKTLRQKAEESLEKQRVVRTPVSLEDAQRLLHELDVHQIELEMQNEELRRAQVELDAARARYFDLYDLAPVGYCTVSEQGLLLEANLTAATLFGLARGALVKQPISRFILKEDMNIYYLHRKKIFETGEPQAFELRMVKKDGTAFWAHLEATAAQNETGAPVCRVVLSDITGRKRAEQELTHSHDLMRYIIEHNRSAVAVYDRDLKYLYVSQRYLQDYNVKEQDVIGKHHYDVFPDVPQKWRDAQQKALAGEVSSAEDDPYVREDGAVDWTRWECRPWYEADGSIGGTIIYTEIITGRKLAEEAVLREKDCTQAVIDSVPGLFFVCDDQLRFLRWNKNFETVTGYCAEEISSMSPMDILGEQDREAIKEAIQNAVQTDETTLEADILSKDQTRTPYFFSEKLFIIDEEACMLGVGIDITERKLAAEALRKSEEANRALINATDDGACILDLEFNFIFLNEQMAKRFGKTVDELMGVNILSYFPLDIAAERRANLLAVLQAGAPGQFENEHNGRIYYDTLYPISDEKGVASRMAIFSRDITQSKRAEEALRIQKERLQTIFDNAPVMIALLDSEGRHQLINRCWQSTLGWSLEEALYEDVLTGTYPDPAYREYVLDHIKRAAGSWCEFKTTTRDGLVLDTSWINVLLSDGSNIGIGIDITERKRAEQNLKASTEQLRAYFYLPIIGIAVTSSEKGWIDCNPKLCQMLGYSEAELRTKSWSDLTPAEDQPIEKNKFLGIMNGEISLPHTFEKRFIKKDGAIITTELSTDVIGERGSEAFVAFIHDITGRKQMETTIQRSMDELKAIYDGTQVMLCVIDAGRSVLQANRAFVEFTGWSASASGQEKACGVFGCINALDDPRGCGFGPHCEMCKVHVAIADTLSTGRTHTDIDYRTTLLRKGRRVDVSLLCSTVMISTGDETRVLLSLLDITARKLAGEALMQSEEDYRQLFDAESDAIFLIDNTTSRILQANKAAASLYGYEHDELLKLKITDISAQPEHGVLHMQTVLPVIGQIVKIPLRQHRRKDGAEFPVEITARSFLQNGRAVYLAAIRDITERMRTEDELGEYRYHLEDLVRVRTEELALATNAAESANRAKSMFLANMSHEFRSPMNSIIGFSEILEKLVQDARQRQYVKRIRESGSALLTLLNDILDFSKIEAGKMDLRQEPVSLRQALEDVCRMFSQRIEEKNIELCSEVEQAVPGLMLLDPVRLRQILLNLIGNAVKFTEAGRVLVRVNAQGMQGQEGCRRDISISVQDTGIGIPEDELERIFEPFEQQKGPVMKGYGGTGLGLSITRSLVESMGGRIRVESRVGEGSVFTVELPVAEAAKGELEQKGEPGRGGYDEVRFRQALVLVVDDIDYNREIIRGFYDGFDIEVEEAENGQGALEKARQRKPDLILLDMKMPVMDGDEFMRALKSEKALRDIPVIAVTAHALKEEEMRIRAICQGYMCKPLRREDLIRETMQYVPYTFQSPAQDARSGAEISEAERAGLVAGLPDELVRALNRAADMADVGRMRELIGEVKRIDGRLGALLAGYAGCYNYNGIGEVLKGSKVQS